VRRRLFFQKNPRKNRGLTNLCGFKHLGRLSSFITLHLPYLIDNNIINLLDNNLIIYFSFARIFFNFDCYLELKKLRAKARVSYDD